jgi:hypothetical protein
VPRRFHQEGGMMEKKERIVNIGVRLILNAEIAKREASEAQALSAKKKKELDKFLKKTPPELVKEIWEKIKEEKEKRWEKQ